MTGEKIKHTFGSVEVRVTQFGGHLHGVDDALVNLGFIAGLVPSCASAVAEHRHRSPIVELEVWNSEVELRHCYCNLGSVRGRC